MFPPQPNLTHLKRFVNAAVARDSKVIRFFHREEGFRLLVKGLGTAGTVNFLRRFGGGIGEYAKERETLVDGVTIDGIAGRIRERKSHG